MSIVIQKPLRLTTHLAQQLRAQSNEWREPTKTAIKDLLLRIDRAQKFMCPLDGLFFEDYDMSHFIGLLRLPFPKVVLEYGGTFYEYGVTDVVHKVGGRILNTEYNGKEDGVKIVLFAEEMVALPTANGSMTITDDPEYMREGPTGLQITVAYQALAGNNSWVLLPTQLYLPLGLTGEQLRASPGTVPGARYYCIAGMEIAASKTDWDLNHWAMITWKESMSLLQFCAAVSCRNVIIDEIPAPRMLNKMRAAKKKAPFYSYKVLTVDVSARHESSGEKLGGGGTHASPRQHLRRGHIRRYKNGLTIWVQQTIVGDAKLGRVEKDYRIIQSSKKEKHAAPT